MKSIVDMLFEHKDRVYKDFTSKLIPNISKDKIIGVKMLYVRRVAKEVKRLGLVNDFLSELPHKYHEENLMHGALLNNLKSDSDDIFKKLDEFLPYVDNWAICDCISINIFKKQSDAALEKIKAWVRSDHEYTVRFGIVCLLKYFLDENFTEEVNTLVAGIHRNEYYINMAIAWYFSYALIKQYDKTIYIFENKILDKWVHNKSIQKATESYRTSEKTKKYLRSLKI